MLQNHWNKHYYIGHMFLISRITVILHAYFCTFVFLDREHCNLHNLVSPLHGLLLLECSCTLVT